MNQFSEGDTVRYAYQGVTARGIISDIDYDRFISGYQGAAKVRSESTVRWVPLDRLEPVAL